MTSLINLSRRLSEQNSSSKTATANSVDKVLLVWITHFTFKLRVRWIESLTLIIHSSFLLHNPLYILFDICFVFYRLQFFSLSSFFFWLGIPHLHGRTYSQQKAISIWFIYLYSYLFILNGTTHKITSRVFV